jgi:hypothetical protein
MITFTLALGVQSPGDKEPVVSEIKYLYPFAFQDCREVLADTAVSNIQLLISTALKRYEDHLAAEKQRIEAEEAKTKEAQTKEAQTKEAQTKEAQTKEAQTKEAQTKEAQTGDQKTNASAD